MSVKFNITNPVQSLAYFLDICRSAAEDDEGIHPDNWRPIPDDIEYCTAAFAVSFQRPPKSEEWKDAANIIDAQIGGILTELGVA